MNTNKLRAALLSAFLVFATVASSGSVAHAYPTGQNMTVTASKYQVSPAGTAVSVRASHVYPGCLVELYFKGYEGDSVSAFANQNGVTPLVSLATPNKNGTYKLTAETPWYCRPPAGVETATATVVVSASHGSKTFTISGFASGASSLSTSMKATLASYARLYTSAKKVVVKGYTQGSKATSSQKATAVRRASNTYAYLKTINKSLVLSSAKSYSDLSNTGAAVRRVSVTFSW